MAKLPPEDEDTDGVEVAWGEFCYSFNLKPYRGPTTDQHLLKAQQPTLRYPRSAQS